MKALYFAPFEADEEINTEDFEDTLGGEVDYIWPFDEEDICLVVLADREDLSPNRTFEACGTIRGPFLAVGSHDDFDDLMDDEIAFLESSAAFAEEEYDLDEADPYEEDAQEEEDYCGTHVVDEDEFYDSISGNYL